MLKNVAGQKVTLLVIDVSTNTPKDGDSANLTVYVSKDDGPVTVLADLTATELDPVTAKGLYEFELSQAETNADKLVFSGTSSTANVIVIPITIYTRTSEACDLLGPHSIVITVVNSVAVPIQGARVRVLNGIQTDTEETDSNGEAEFTVDGLVWTILVSKPGYTGASSSINVPSELSKSVVLSLAPSSGVIPCVTPEDLLGFRVGCQPVNICCPESEIELNLEIAYELIKAITNTEWCPQEACLRFDGTGGPRLHFNHVTTSNLVTIDTITDLSCCGSEHELDITDLVNHGTWLEFPCDGCFPCGNKNIEICGTWGRPMPAGIKKAIIMLALEGIEPGSSGLSNPNGIRNATWEDFRISYSIEERPRGVLTTGFQEIDDLLTIYTPTSSLVNFVAVPENQDCQPKQCGMVSRKRCCSKRGNRCGN